MRVQIAHSNFHAKKGSSPGYFHLDNGVRPENYMFVDSHYGVLYSTEQMRALKKLHTLDHIQLPPHVLLIEHD